MNDITFMIVKLIFSVIMVFFAYYIRPILKQYAKSKELESLYEFINICIKSAEQTITSSGHGIDKKRKVMEAAIAFAQKNNIDIDLDQIDDLIECGVYILKNEKDTNA